MAHSLRGEELGRELLLAPEHLPDRCISAGAQLEAVIEATKEVLDVGRTLNLHRFRDAVDHSLALCAARSCTLLLEGSVVSPDGNLRVHDGGHPWCRQVV